MFSNIVPATLTVNLILAGKGHELKPLIVCYKVSGISRVAVLKAIGERPITEADKIRITCVANVVGYGYIERLSGVICTCFRYCPV